MAATPTQLAASPATSTAPDLAATSPAPSLSPPPRVLASHACNTCRSRKKGCDKRLPTCGYCSRRSLSCRYLALVPDRKEDSSLPSSLRLDDTLPLDHVGPAASQASQITTIHCSAQSSLMFVDSILEAIQLRLSGLQGSGESLGLDHVLRSQVDRLTRARGCYLDDITSRYFQGMHKWLPVISRNKFQAEFINNQIPWPADFSILLLAMFLVVWRPSPESGIDDDRGTLHVVIKMLFAQVQAILPPSMRLIQAGLLISVFEYAHELKNAALASITSWAKIAYIMRPNAHTSGEARFETREERNLWWGLVIYESCSAFSQPFSTEFPSMKDDLPSEYEVLDQTPDTIHSEYKSLADWSNKIVGSFGRSAQATFLLSRTIESMKIDELKVRHSVLSDIDAQLQQLLSILLKQGGGTCGPYCGAVAITLKALFILHQCLLDQAILDGDVGIFKESSLATLDSMTRMLIDIASSFNQNLPVLDLELYPPVCVHLVRWVMYDFLGINSLRDKVGGHNFQELSKMLYHLNNRWKIIDHTKSI